MTNRLIADLLVLAHLAFIIFALLGGLLALRRRWIIFIHLPAAIWISLIEFKGWICPLTVWENHYRRAAGAAGYSESFIEHYIIPIIYPPGLTPNIQIALGIIALAVNLLIYSLVWRRWRLESLTIDN